MTNGEAERQPGALLVLAQDCGLSAGASLLAVLLVRWLSEPIPGFTRVVLVWLGLSLAASLLGMLISGSHKVVRRWATVSSSARLLGAVAIKEAVMALAVLLHLVPMPGPALAVVAVLTDTMITTLLLLYIRFAARVFSRSEVNRVKEEAARKNALVVGTSDDSVQLAASLEDEYNVVGFITEDPALAGSVIRDTVVYHCAGQDDLSALEWRLGGIDCVCFPRISTPPHRILLALNQRLTKVAMAA